MKLILVAGAIAMALAVVLGAFGAHGLKSKISADMMAVYQTGVQYHFYHALGVLLIGLLVQHFPQVNLLHWSAWVLLAGIVLFSGSLYVLSVTGVRVLGAITPIGGVLFIAGWLMLAAGVWRAS